MKYFGERFRLKHGKYFWNLKRKAIQVHWDATAKDWGATEFVFLVATEVLVKVLRCYWECWGYYCSYWYAKMRHDEDGDIISSTVSCFWEALKLLLRVLLRWTYMYLKVFFLNSIEKPNKRPMRHMVPLRDSNKCNCAKQWIYPNVLQEKWINSWFAKKTLRVSTFHPRMTWVMFGGNWHRAFVKEDFEILLLYISYFVIVYRWKSV